MSDMKHDSAFQGELERQMEEHRAERANAAKVAAERVAQAKGWPMELADGSTVMAVEKRYRGQRMVLADETGNEYELNGADKFELVRASDEPQDPAPVAETVSEETPEGGDSE